MCLYSLKIKQHFIVALAEVVDQNRKYFFFTLITLDVEGNKVSETKDK